MFEIIKGFENYMIDRNGNIFNHITGTFKTPTSNKMGKGYMYVDLYTKGKRKRKYVHRLVAEAFIPNPEEKPYINHKDGNPQNNNVKNLEWCSPLENVEHASKVLGIMTQYKTANEKRKRAVWQIDYKTGDKIKKFNSIAEASKETGIATSHIVSICKNKFKQCFGYSWCYVEDLGE